MTRSKLYLVGAGPGDPDLITLKAIKVLKEAQVVLYDALANEDLLDYCSPTCLRIYVGKKPGIHQYQQIYINDMIVDFGRKYERVVRLKGGDPFVFGRGYEELEHAKAHGMDVEVIPGISSSIAVPSLKGIPLTRRETNESFWVITGTTTNLKPSGDLALAAKSSATLIILMGMSNLAQIVNLVRDARGEDEAIGIIQNGSCKNERSIYGTLETIQDQVVEEEIGSPAIIVIGEVVRVAKSDKLSLSEVVRIRK